MEVSAIILTFNEEINIERCLKSLGYCDDIIVVDSFSTDRTLDICKSYGARIIQNKFVDFATQRNFALSQGHPRHSWVLHLDADEELTEKFRDKLKCLQPEPGIYGYRIPSKTILFGRWLRRAGMYPLYQVRLGDRDRCTFYEHGHGQRETLPVSQVGTFDEPYNHYNFSHGLVKWMTKHVGYARAEAAAISKSKHSALSDPVLFTGYSLMTQRRRLKHLAGKLPPYSRPLARFLYMAILRRGFLDGGAGLLYCFMMSTYEAMIAIFIVENRRILPKD